MNVFVYFFERPEVGFRPFPIPADDGIREEFSLPNPTHIDSVDLIVEQFNTDGSCLSENYRAVLILIKTGAVCSDVVRERCKQLGLEEVTPKRHDMLPDLDDALKEVGLSTAEWEYGYLLVSGAPSADFRF